jgi:threonine/homoserine/homoserine lactone efflux protein
LIFLAWTTWHRPRATSAANTIDAAGLGRCFLGKLVLTLSNPLTILFFAGVFASMSWTFASTAPRLMVIGHRSASAAARSAVRCMLLLGEERAGTWRFPPSRMPPALLRAPVLLLSAHSPALPAKRL